MAGSLDHLINEDGEFTHDLIENLGDSREACEECFYLLGVLADWDRAKLDLILERYYAEKRGEVPKTAQRWLLPGMCSGGTCKGRNKATSPHPCPYMESVRNDPEALCTCCDECQRRCAADV